MKTKTRYINIETPHNIDTVAQFPYNTKEERKYFAKILKEYQLSDKYNTYYSSQRCTNDWKNN